MFDPRGLMVTVSVIATLAGGGSAAANWGSDGAVAGELPNGCSESWSSEGSID